LQKEIPVPAGIKPDNREREVKKLLVVLLSLGLILLPFMTVSGADMSYYFGKVAAVDSGTLKLNYVDVGAYFKARMELGPAYVGISALYSSRDEGGDKRKRVMGLQSQDLYFGLILGNEKSQTWEVSRGNSGPRDASPFEGGNARSAIYSVFGGFNATPKLNVNATLVTAQRSQGSTKYASNKSKGAEFDITARYQIYDNLSYMLGAGYLWTSDYLKGASSAGEVGNDYLLMNRLSLSF